MPCPTCLCDTPCNVVDVYPLLPSIYPVQDDSENWMVLCHWVSQLVQGRAVFVRRDFGTDGTSIPRWAWTLIGSPLGKALLRHALAHDALYAAELMSRKECDLFLFDSMALAGVPLVKRNAIYAAVRIGGAAVWKLHTDESVAEARSKVRLLTVSEWSVFANPQ